MPLNHRPHVLIVDDDRQIRSMLARFLGDHGLRVSEAKDGVQMFAALDAASFDLILLDVMMPGEDGFSLCRRLQGTGSPVPVILLTAMNSATERVVGLELGADDYVAKPFNPPELLARIKAVLRRTSLPSSASTPTDHAVYRFAGWTLDAGHRNLISLDGVLTDLTSGEFDLLLAFAEHPQRVLSRDQLLDLAHRRTSNAFDRSIDVQISRLRRKIEIDPQEPRLIKTVRNEGYYFTADVLAEGKEPLP